MDMLSNGNVTPRNQNLILIVDDQIENLQVLGNILKEYRKAVSTSGLEAISVAEKIQPDLIILDIMMPEVDGFEVCRRLKENELTRDIPVIFLTARIQTEDMVKGFQLGAVDYIIKPFEQEELHIRVKTQIELRNSRLLIMKQNENLLQLNQERSEFLSIAAHDLKNPLKVIHGFSKLIEEKYETFSELEVRDFIKDIRDSAETMLEIISDMLDIQALEENKVGLSIENLNLIDLIQQVISGFSREAYNKNIHIKFDDNLETSNILSDFIRIRLILINIISNALKFSFFNKNIYIKAYNWFDEEKNSKIFRVEIQDEGPGIIREEMDMLYVKFKRLSSRPTNNERCTGLGLSIVKKSIELLGGDIFCESEPGKGTTFVLDFPDMLNMYEPEN
jgi:two-component system, sensor histidine kinase and response regulator